MPFKERNRSEIAEGPGFKSRRVHHFVLYDRHLTVEELDSSNSNHRKLWFSGDVETLQVSNPGESIAFSAEKAGN